MTSLVMWPLGSTMGCFSSMDSGALVSLPPTRMMSLCRKASTGYSLLDVGKVVFEWRRL